MPENNHGYTEAEIQAKREMLAAVARRWAHLEKLPRDHIADMRKNRPSAG